MFNLFKHSSRLNINLLPKDPFSSSPVGKFLNWALSVGRYIVVFTEMVVILTFLSRFTLDRQLTDLNETILKKQALLESYSNLEEKVRIIQGQAEFITNIESATNVSTNLEYLIQIIPNDIIFDTLDIRQDRFVITGRAFSQTSLASFIETLKQDNQYEEVNIDQIKKTEKDTAINFIVRTKYQPGINNNNSIENLN